MIKFNSINARLFLIIIFYLVFLSSCSTINTIQPEVNLMRLDVQDVTLSHVNLLAELRVFNPNEKSITIQGVDYTLHIEGTKVFSGQNRLSKTMNPQEYTFLTLRLASAYWNIISLLNKLPDKSDVSFSMQGSIKVGESSIFPKSFSFEKEGVIPIQKSSRMSQ